MKNWFYLTIVTVRNVDLFWYLCYFRLLILLILLLVVSAPAVTMTMTQHQYINTQGRCGFDIYFYLLTLQFLSLALVWFLYSPLQQFLIQNRHNAFKSRTRVHQPRSTTVRNYYNVVDLCIWMILIAYFFCKNFSYKWKHLNWFSFELWFSEKKMMK